MKVARWILISFVAGLALLVASLWLEHRTAVELPAPSGPFAVGRVIEAWGGRELVVWIWYPAASGPRAAADDYLPAALRTATERARGPLISKFLTRDLSKVRTHSLRDAEVSREEASYPVVLLRAGASAGVGNYSILAEDLASHGYVVVGFDVPYRTDLVVLPDGRAIRRTPENDPERCLGRSDREQCVNRIVAAWTADMAFVLDRLGSLNRFAGRLDMTRVGVVGHSLGGATALQFCREDARCKAGIDLDGAPQGSVIQAGVRQPFLFLLSDHSQETDPESRQIMADIQSIYDRLPAAGRSRIAIRGANHFTFSDDGAVLKSGLFRGLLRLFGKLRIDGRRQLAVTAYCVRSFFDAYLKGGSLELSSPRFPEIQMLE